MVFSRLSQHPALILKVKVNVKCYTSAEKVKINVN